MHFFQINKDIPIKLLGSGPVLHGHRQQTVTTKVFRNSRMLIYAMKIVPNIFTKVSLYFAYFKNINLWLEIREN